MFKLAKDLLRAIRRDQYRGIILYRGPSALDGKPIVVIANRITEASDNGKTGAMVQTFIIRSDIDPMEALRNSGDFSICGNCVHRPKLRKDGKRIRTCYVNVGRSVMAVWGAFQRGRYAEVGVDFPASLLPEIFAALKFRAGTYGDPTAAPFQIWRACTLKVAGKTGYTHQWRDKRFQAFKTILMASVDSNAEADEAEAMGWRCFRVRGKNEPIRMIEVVCPASAEAGHRTSCDKCKLCGGNEVKTNKSIVIIAHGATADSFQVAA